MSPVKIEEIMEAYKTKIDQTILSWFPLEFSAENVVDLCGKPNYSYDLQTFNKVLMNPSHEILSRGGKRWRPVLLLLIGEALLENSLQNSVEPLSNEEKERKKSERAEKLLPLVCIAELVHNGSLIIDDIEDQSQLRRGKPCLHLLYGVDISVNVGCALYFFPLTVLRKLRGKVDNETLIQAYELYSQEMINLHVGQGLDIGWHNGLNSAEPSVSDYLQMCAYKTGTLARLSAKLSALLSDAQPEVVKACGRFAEVIGVAFQIQDDILNLVGEKFTTSITGEDIHEGKRSLIVIHCFQTGKPEKVARLKEILKLHTTERALIDEAIEILKENGSIEYSKQKATELALDGWKEIEPFLVNSPAKEMLHSFTNYLVNREI